MRFDLDRAERGLRINGMEAGYVPAPRTTLQWVRAPSNRLHLKAEEWQRYERRFPAMARDKIFMSVDEYAYTGAPANLKLALAYAMALNEMLRHTDFLTMSAFTMGISTLDFNASAATLNTTGLLFKLYGDHLGAGWIPVVVSGNSAQPPPRYPVLNNQPERDAGSPTYPLDAVAALSTDGRFLALAVVNATNLPQRLVFRVQGVRIVGKPILWEMTGKSLDAANRLDERPQVAVSEATVSAAPGTLTIPPLSADIYRLPVSK
jgi:alpha-N-arabinofuranosidase